jgi:hypothetical protein
MHAARLRRASWALVSGLALSAALVLMEPPCDVRPALRLYILYSLASALFGAVWLALLMRGEDARACALVSGCAAVALWRGCAALVA